MWVRYIYPNPNNRVVSCCQYPRKRQRGLLREVLSFAKGRHQPSRCCSSFFSFRGNMHHVSVWLRFSRMSLRSRYSSTLTTLRANAPPCAEVLYVTSSVSVVCAPFECLLSLGQRRGYVPRINQKLTHGMNISCQRAAPTTTGGCTISNQQLFVSGPSGPLPLVWLRDLMSSLSVPLYCSHSGLTQPVLGNLFNC